VQADTVPEERLTDPEQPSTFDSVIQGLRSTYSKDKMEEISTSFCFICLLHLANERGLKIEVGENNIIPDEDVDVEDEDKMEERRRVGDIWSLKVYRDPTAIALA
jgi:condensin complex subunit 2